MLPAVLDFKIDCVSGVDRRARVSAPRQCVVCPAPSRAPAGPRAPGASPVFSFSAHATRARGTRGRGRAAQSVASFAPRRTPRPHRAQSSLQSVQSTVRAECTVDCVSRDSPRSDMHMDMHIVGGRYYQYGVAVYGYRSSCIWAMAGGVRGCACGGTCDMAGRAGPQAAVPGSRDFATWGV